MQSTASGTSLKNLSSIFTRASLHREISPRGKPGPAPSLPSGDVSILPSQSTSGHAVSLLQACYQGLPWACSLPVTASHVIDGARRASRLRAAD